MTMVVCKRPGAVNAFPDGTAPGRRGSAGMSGKLDLAAADRAARKRLPRCRCGGSGFAFRPGTLADRDPAVILRSSRYPRLTSRERADQTFCLSCWRRRFGPRVGTRPEKRARDPPHIFVRVG